MKKIKVFLASLLLALSVAAIPSAAHADSSWTTNYHCHDQTSYFFLTGTAYFTFCMKVRYHTQADGTGVSVDHVWLDTTRGCADLERDGNGKVISRMDTYDVSPGWDSHVDGGSHTYYNCDADIDVSLRGADTGSTNVQIGNKYRVNDGPDIEQDSKAFNFTICKGGPPC